MPVRPRRVGWHLWALILLAFGFGMSLAGLSDALDAADTWWACGFAVFTAADAALYFWTVHWWLKWVN